MYISFKWSFIDNIIFHKRGIWVVVTLLVLSFWNYKKLIWKQFFDIHPVSCTVVHLFSFVIYFNLCFKTSMLWIYGGYYKSWSYRVKNFSFQHKKRNSVFNWSCTSNILFVNLTPMKYQSTSLKKIFLAVTSTIC